MKLLKYFDEFLDSVVNLNPYRMEQLDTRTKAITNYLKRDEEIGPLFAASIPQGSFAQKTIIKPKTGGSFDADLLIHLDPKPDWEAGEYVGKLYSALGRSAVYKDMRSRRTRCVVVDYADEFHVDLVPYVEDNGVGQITNRHENCFHTTDPKGFTGWLKDRNRDANGHLIKVIRLLKYIRDIRDERKSLNVKSVVLTTIVGGQVKASNAVLEPGCYADVPTTLRSVVRDLNRYLQANPVLPSIPDPGRSGDDLRNRWDQESYMAFRARFDSLAAKIETAYVAEDKESLALWQEVFGDAFKAPPKAEGRAAIITVGGKQRPITERFLNLDYGFPFVDTHIVHMEGRVTRKDGFRHGPLPANGNVVGPGRELVFEVKSTSVPAPYDVYWKVRNTGQAARNAGALRGEIRQSTSDRIVEPTRYPGQHYVECYIVKNGRCLARSRQNVVIS